MIGVVEVTEVEVGGRLHCVRDARIHEARSLLWIIHAEAAVQQSEDSFREIRRAIPARSGRLTARYDSGARRSRALKIAFIDGLS